MRALLVSRHEYFGSLKIQFMGILVQESIKLFKPSANRNLVALV